MFIMALIAVIAVFIMYRKLVNKKKEAGVQGWVKSQDLDGRGGRFTGIIRPGYQPGPTWSRATGWLSTKWRT